MFSILFLAAVLSPALILLAKILPPPPPSELSEREIRQFEEEQRKREEKLREQAKKMRENRLDLLMKRTEELKKQSESAPKKSLFDFLRRTPKEEHPQKNILDLLKESSRREAEKRKKETPLSPKAPKGPGLVDKLRKTTKNLAQKEGTALKGMAKSLVQQERKTLGSLAKTWNGMKASYLTKRAAAKSKQAAKERERIAEQHRIKLQRARQESKLQIERAERDTLIMQERKEAERKKRLEERQKEEETLFEERGKERARLEREQRLKAQELEAQREQSRQRMAALQAEKRINEERRKFIEAKKGPSLANVFKKTTTTLIKKERIALNGIAKNLAQTERKTLGSLATAWKKMEQRREDTRRAAASKRAKEERERVAEQHRIELQREKEDAKRQEQKEEQRTLIMQERKEAERKKRLEGRRQTLGQAHAEQQRLKEAETRRVHEQEQRVLRERAHAIQLRAWALKKKQIAEKLKTLFESGETLTTPSKLNAPHYAFRPIRWTRPQPGRARKDVEDLFEERRKEREQLKRDQESKEQEARTIEEAARSRTAEEAAHERIKEEHHKFIETSKKDAWKLKVKSAEQKKKEEELREVQEEEQHLLKEHERAMRKRAWALKQKHLVDTMARLIHPHERKELKRQKAIVHGHLNTLKEERLQAKLTAIKEKKRQEDHQWLFEMRHEEKKRQVKHRELKQQERDHFSTHEARQGAQKELDKALKTFQLQSRDHETELDIERKRRAREAHVAQENAKRAHALRLPRDAYVEIEDAKRNAQLISEGRIPETRQTVAKPALSRTPEARIERGRHEAEQTLLRTMIEQEERRIHEEARQLPSFISQDRMPPAQEMKIKMERERIRQEAARTVDERSREILKQERAHLHDIHRALKQVKRESVYPIALQKEHYTKTQFLSREVEEIMDLIGTAREEMMRLNLVRVKMVYEDIMRLYLRLSPREKGSVHQEIHDLYNERKRAEALFTHY